MPSPSLSPSASSCTLSGGAPATSGFLTSSLESLPAPTLACLRVLEALSRSDRKPGSPTSGKDRQGETDLLSFCTVHQLLQDAKALDTPAKYAHMFHALCVAADRRVEGLTAVLRERRESPERPPGHKKKRRVRLESGEQSSEEAGNPDSEDRQKEPTTPGGPQAHAKESVCSSEDEIMVEEQENLSPNILLQGNRYRRSGNSGGVSGQDEETDQSLSPSAGEDAERTEHRQVVADHVAGFLLGTLEGLKPPPALGADDFLERVSHVLCRVLYMHRPAEPMNLVGENSEGYRESHEMACLSDGRHNGSSCCSGTFPPLTSAEACRNRWRRDIVQRFKTVEQLLLCSRLKNSGGGQRTLEGVEDGNLGSCGTERCRRALRVVRHWAAFVLELEKKRRELIERVMKASEEVQGLTHMLLEVPSSPQNDRKGESSSLVVIAGVAEFSRKEAAERGSASAGGEDDRRKLEEENAMKKTSAAAAVVSYVNERMQEQDQASVAVNAALPGSATAMTAVLRQRSVCHPFYLLGLNPQTTTVQAVESVKKRWRVLLHPDKFHSIPHLLHQATEAFKAFQLAIDEALRALSQRRIDSAWAPPPPPPDLSSTSPIPSVTGSSPSCPAPPRGSVSVPASQGSGVNTSEKCPPMSFPLPTRHFSPDFSIEVAPRRKSLGVFCVYVPATVDPAFTEITEIRVYVHRPIRDGPPGALLPSPEALSGLVTKKVSLTTAVNAGEDGQAAEEKVQIVDAVQPLELGEERTYWVGVQVEGKKKDYSLIRWQPVYLRLALPPSLDMQVPVTASSSTAFEKKDECSNVASELRALVAFLGTFAEASFLDSGTRAKVVQSAASLKRLLVYFARRRTRKDGGEEGRREIISEYSYSTRDARQLLQRCIEKAKVWADRHS